MRIGNFFLLLILTVVFVTRSGYGVGNRFSDPSEKKISAVVNGIIYEAGNWSHPDYSKPFKTLGNHRFVIKVNRTGKYVRIRVPWRRADENPSAKGVVVVDAKRNEQIKNLIVVEINNEYGEFVFEPAKDSDTYFLYYLPHESTGGYYPKVRYVGQKDNTNREWKNKYLKLSREQKGGLPEVKVVAAQSIDPFHSFFPMEIVAGEGEVKEFIEFHSHKFYLFPEFRENPIRMTKFLPLHWITRGFKDGIRDKVKRGEFYTFQIGVYSPKTDLTDVKVTFTGLRSSGGGTIEKTGIECFNVSGIDLKGKYFSKNLNLKRGRVQPLWFGVDIPKNIDPGKYRGEVAVSADGISSENVKIELNVSKDTIKNHGDDNPEKMSRLRWLNSLLGVDRNFIIKPFTPVLVEGKTLKIQGREIVLEETGLPGEIFSYFTKEMTHLKSDPEKVLAEPISFNVISRDGNPVKWIPGRYKIDKQFKGDASWNVRSDSNDFILKVKGSLEYDGMLNYQIELIAKKDVEISNVFLNIPIDKDAALYMLGLGKKGGKRPKNISWKWDVNFHQEGVWLGNVNKGLQYVLRDKNYERPLNTNFYHNKPLNLPLSWGNNGTGGILIEEKNGVVSAKNYSGARVMKKGEILNFNIRFLITPFKLIDIKKHFQTRFVHKYLPVDEVIKLGGTVVNVHHATEINPYINYPFFNLEKQRAYIGEAHKNGIKVKLYNTIRELTYKAYEIFALKSLGDEIFNDGEGGGHSWLQEHFRSHYHSAWHASRVNDAAILDKGTSRWTNYYIEGLNWLAKNQKIDGLYLDDISFSRETVKRIVTVLNKQRGDVIIDLHSANQFNERDGFINSAFLYMEHFPYISRLWFGEYFEYGMGPDYWLTEVSGIPFGLTGEMLEKGGHPFRGMVYGMTTRVYGKYNPGELWKLFDEFGIAESRMLGYWVKDSPITTSVKNIRSTIYKLKKRVLIAIGSWSENDEKVKLNIDWEKLGFNGSEAILFAPEIKGLQKYKKFDPTEPVKVEKEKGIILILKKGVWKIGSNTKI